nr:venom peptide [Acharia stimulea]
MKFIIVLCLAVFSVSAETYNDKYDDTDTTEILQNCRMLVPYMKCMLGTGKCTSAAQEMKDNTDEAIKTKCEKCTEKQKQKIKEVVNNLAKCQPTFWKKITDIHDADGSLRKENKSDYEDLISGEVDCTQFKECDINTGRPVGE